VAVASATIVRIGHTIVIILMCITVFITYDKDKIAPRQKVKHYRQGDEESRSPTANDDENGPQSKTATMMRID